MKVIVKMQTYMPKCRCKPIIVPQYFANSFFICAEAFVVFVLEALTPS